MDVVKGVVATAAASDDHVLGPGLGPGLGLHPDLAAGAHPHLVTSLGGAASLGLAAVKRGPPPNLGLGPNLEDNR